MSNEAGWSMARRDELLELLYWLEGEQLQRGGTLDAMTRFLSRPASDVAAALVDLEARGDVRCIAPGQYRLTESGHREAARRFADELASHPGQGHGECDDPGCECHTSSEGAARCSPRS